MGPLHSAVENSKFLTVAFMVDLRINGGVCMVIV